MCLRDSRGPNSTLRRAKTFFLFHSFLTTAPTVSALKRRLSASYFQPWSPESLADTTHTYSHRRCVRTASVFRHWQREMRFPPAPPPPTPILSLFYPLSLPTSRACDLTAGLEDLVTKKKQQHGRFKKSSAVNNWTRRKWGRVARSLEVSSGGGRPPGCGGSDGVSKVCASRGVESF